MKRFLEEMLDVVIELTPILLFISIFVGLVFLGGMMGWLGSISEWMFGPTV